jgi:hypothetical protein
MKREAPSNSKMKRLCRLLDIPLYHAVGMLELLWHTTAREAPCGDIGKLSNEDIALSLDYRGDENKLIDALVRTGWLDVSSEYRLLVHDWHEHADEAVKKRLTRSGRSFIRDKGVETKPTNVETKDQNGNLPRTGAGPEPGAEPTPEPEPVPEKKRKASSTRVDASLPFPQTDNPGQQQPRQPPGPEAYVKYWNAHCGPLPKVRDFTDERKKKLKARIDHGLDPEKFKEVMAKLLASPFCRGENDRGKKTTFDFVIASDTNVAKILDGNYDKAEKPKPEKIFMRNMNEALGR